MSDPPLSRSPSSIQDGQDSESGVALSPTGTVRRVSTSLRALPDPMESTQPSGEPSKGNAGQQQWRRQDPNVGLGRPGEPSRSSRSVSRESDSRLQPNVETSNFPLRFQNPRSAVSPGRTASISTEDSSYTDSLPPSQRSSYRPKSAFLTAMSNLNPNDLSGEQTPRVSGREPPQTAIGPGSSGVNHGSPSINAADYNAGSGRGTGGSRPKNSRANTAIALPASGSMGTVRSTSRARPPLTAVPIVKGGKAAADGADEDEEDEDRGAALIRQRQKDRKRARKAKEKERAKRAEGGEGLDDASAPPTGVLQPGQTFRDQQDGYMTSKSRARTPSAHTDRRQRSDSYFGAGVGGGDRDGRRTPMEELRPPSVYSTSADEDEAGTAHDAASVVDEVVQEVIDEHAGMDEQDEDEDDDDEGDASGEGDEGVTLKDRQDALNIEHPFGLPIWKPALYQKSRSVTRNAESALHAIPSAAAERHLLPGNILWVILFGWWLTIACFFVAVLVSGAEVLGGGRGGYGKTLRGLAWYIGWPFGKYVEGEGGPEDDEDDEEDGDAAGYGAADEESPSRNRINRQRQVSDGASSGITVRDYREMTHANASEDHRPDSALSTVPETASTVTPVREAAVSFAPIDPHGGRDALRGLTQAQMDERAPLLLRRNDGYQGFRRPRRKWAKILGRIVYWPGFIFIVAPLMLFVSIICWGLVITIPMAKLNWALIKLLYFRPLEINFNSAPKIPVVDQSSGSRQTSTSYSQTRTNSGSGDESGETTLAGSGSGSGSRSNSQTSPYKHGDSPHYTMKAARLTAGQVAPTPGYKSTVLLCTYRAVGLQYYKYTIGGVNIMFINLLPLVFFTIIDAFLLLPAAEEAHRRGHTLDPFVALITSQALIFVLSLASVIPLSYFIGMAVASISAQSSIGMGAVINATFGSIIEIILYGIALTQGKGRLVEGSIIGSILAGVLLMPGASMCSGALKKKEMKFNAKSAGVTSTMLIMAIIGTLTPTMFYQTYGSFELHCQGCPAPTSPSTTSLTAFANHSNHSPKDAWKCNNCYYEHPDPAEDPFYQDQVKTLMYACAGILLFSYIIGLWFSLRTHAAQIYQNPQQLMKPEENAATGGLHPAVRSTLQQRSTLPPPPQSVLPLHRDNSQDPNTSMNTMTTSSPIATNPPMSLRLPPSKSAALTQNPSTPIAQKFSTSNLPPNPSSEVSQRFKSTDRDFLDPADGSRGSARVTSGAYNLPVGYSPFLENVDRDIKSNNMNPMRLPSTLTTEDFTRAVAVATVSALRHQRSIIGASGGSGQNMASRRDRSAHAQGVHTSGAQVEKEEAEGHGGHEAPSWTRGVSAGVLLGCTLLYAIIAEILVDVVDVVLHGSGIDEKFLGLTLFALVPNTTEFMNAMSFAMNGNIALSMEIGSAYALQVCLLQIPAMVAFSAVYDPAKLGEVVDTFTLIFPRWDVIAIILSIFLLTYTYIEARSNYHRGSILVLAYVVLIMGFYYAPTRISGESDTTPDPERADVIFKQGLDMLSVSLQTSFTKLWA